MRERKLETAFQNNRAGQERSLMSSREGRTRL